MQITYTDNDSGTFFQTPEYMIGNGELTSCVFKSNSKKLAIAKLRLCLDPVSLVPNRLSFWRIILKHNNPNITTAEIENELRDNIWPCFGTRFHFHQEGQLKHHYGIGVRTVSLIFVYLGINY